MVDINLLPEEMRKREEKERKAAEKKPKVFEIELSVPEKEHHGEEKKKGFFSRWLAKKEKKLPTPQKPPLQKHLPAEEHQKHVEPEKPPPPEPPKKKTAIDTSEIHALGKDVSSSPEREPEKPPPLDSEPDKKNKVYVEARMREKEEEKRPRPASSVSFQEPQEDSKTQEVVVKEVELPIPIQKKRGFWQWLFALFRREKAPKNHRVVLEKPKKPIDAQAPLEQTAQQSQVLKSEVEEKKVIKQKGRRSFWTRWFSFGARKKPRASDQKIPPSAQGKHIKKPSKGIPQESSKKTSKVMTPVQTIEINLIPEDIAQSPERGVRERVIALFLIMLSAGLIVSLWYGVAVYRQKQIGNEIWNLQRRFLVLQKEVEAYEKNRSEVEDLRRRIDLANKILNRHIYWTRVLEELEKTTIDEVYFTSFAADKDGRMYLSAVGKDYESVARQITAFEQADHFVFTVKVDSASAQSFVEKSDGEIEITKTSFGVQLLLNPRIFFQEEL